MGSLESVDAAVMGKCIITTWPSSKQIDKLNANINLCSSRGPGSYKRSGQRQVPFSSGVPPRSTGTQCMPLVKTLQRTTTCERSSI